MEHINNNRDAKYDQFMIIIIIIIILMIADVNMDVLMHPINICVYINNDTIWIILHYLMSITLNVIETANLCYYWNATNNYDNNIQA